MSTVFYSSYVALWVLAVVEAILLLLVYRHFGMMALGSIEGVQRDGLPIGTQAPAIVGVTASGEDTRWEPTSERAQLALFASPGCEPCEQIIPALREIWSANQGLGIVSIVPGTAESARLLVDKFRPPFTCLADDGSGAFDNYRVRVTPFAFVVDQEGRVLAKGLCNSPDRIVQLFEQAQVQISIPISLKPRIEEPLPMHSSSW